MDLASTSDTVADNLTTVTEHSDQNRTSIQTHFRKYTTDQYGPTTSQYFITQQGKIIYVFINLTSVKNYLLNFTMIISQIKLNLIEFSFSDVDDKPDKVQSETTVYSCAENCKIYL